MLQLVRGIGVKEEPYSEQSMAVPSVWHGVGRQVAREGSGEAVIDAHISWHMASKCSTVYSPFPYTHLTLSTTFRTRYRCDSVPLQ